MKTDSPQSDVTASFLGRAEDNDPDFVDVPARANAPTAQLTANQHETLIKGKPPAITFVKPKTLSYIPPNRDAELMDVPHVRPEPGSGLPHVEKDEALKATRAKHADLLARFKEARSARLAASDALGLAPGHTDAQRDAVAGQLIVDGLDLAPIDNLKQLQLREQALRAATVESARAIKPALEHAIREVNVQVIEEHFVPLKRRVIDAWLALTLIHREHKRMTNLAQSQGLSYGNEGPIFDDRAPVFDVSNLAAVLIATGSATRADFAGLI
jgi:hypothetical protein